MAFHSEWLRNNPKGLPGPIPPKGAEGALGSPLGSHLMPLGPIVPVSRDDNVATRVIGGGAGIARAYKQGRRAARSVYGFVKIQKTIAANPIRSIFEKCFKSCFDSGFRIYVKFCTRSAKKY